MIGDVGKNQRGLARYFFFNFVLLNFERKKNKGTPLEFVGNKLSSKIVTENSPPLIKRDFRFQGGAVPVDFYCIKIKKFPTHIYLISHYEV